VRAMAALLVLLAPLALAACESTADKSARIGREGRKAVQDAGTLKLGRPNPTIRVQRAVMVHGAGGALAAAVQVRNTGASAQADVPLLIDVHGAHGASLYRNDAVGLQPALQRLALAPGHTTMWWVNDQVTAAQAATSVHARVGAARRVAHPPDIALTDPSFSEEAGSRFLTGTLVNRSSAVLRGVLVFGVALKGSRVVAAGRALVAKLPPSIARGRPVHFRLFFVGNPRGARVILTVAPPATTSSRSPA
jgi:hypothetical protein